METKFQTSFIPKKPITSVGGVGTNFTPQQRKHGTTGVFFNIALLLFIISLGLAGGVFAWKSVTLSAQESLKVQLDNRQKQFNTDLIEELKRVNVKIDVVGKLLRNHLALSNIFAVISRMTIERVRFNSLELSLANAQSNNNDITISMKGSGADLSAVAFQSDVLGQLELYGLRKIIKNPILSEPTLETNGMVSFNFSASVDPANLSYVNSLIIEQATSSQDIDDIQ